MKINEDEKIQIKQVLMSNGEPRFVEFYSQSDKKNHIMSADKFADIFGYTLEDLKRVVNV